MASLSPGYRLLDLAARLEPGLGPERGPRMRAWLTAKTESHYARSAASEAVRLRRLIAGREVLVVGSGPSLNQVTPGQFDRLAERFFVIGVNRTFYRARLHLFLSAYPSEQCLAGLYPRRAPLRIQIRPRSFIPVIGGTWGWRRILMEPGQPVDDLGKGQPPIIRTKLNVVIGATDLAVRLGATAVWYLGIEQNNQAHYYDTDETLRRRIIDDLLRFRHLDPAMTVDHQYSDIGTMVERLRKPVEQWLDQPFYDQDHRESIRTLFESYAERGAAFYSIGENTVIARAGAGVRGLSDALGPPADSAARPGKT
jgi:hypothetical protein